MEEETNYLFVDAETDGLYGRFISIAMVYADSSGNELEHCYIGLKDPKKHITDNWVSENVLPLMGEYDSVEDEQSLLENAWLFWRAHAHNTYVITDVMYPVESRLFSQCVAFDMFNRNVQAPFPILDLSSMLYSIGINPLEERGKMIQSLDKSGKHNALYDARQTLAVWKKYILPKLQNVKRNNDEYR